MLHRFSMPLSVVSVATLLAAFGALPVAAEPDASKVIIGRSIFRPYCASCHGQEGRGDGPVAEHLNVAPADLTAISARNDGEFPKERIFKIIDGREPVRGHGTSEMPIWGEAFMKTIQEPSDTAVEEKIEALVHFLESLQGS